MFLYLAFKYRSLGSFVSVGHAKGICRFIDMLAQAGKISSSKGPVCFADRFEIFQVGHIFIAPSVAKDGWNMVCAEARANGCAVIVSCKVGLYSFYENLFLRFESKFALSSLKNESPLSKVETQLGYARERLSDEFFASILTREIIKIVHSKSL